MSNKDKAKLILFMMLMSNHPVCPPTDVDFWSHGEIVEFVDNYAPFYL